MVQKLSAEEAHALVEKLHVSSDWLLTGEGPIFQEEGEKEFMRRLGHAKRDGQDAAEAQEEAAPYNNQPTALRVADEAFLMVPKVKARLSAGGGSLETNDEVVGLFAFRAEWLRAKGNPAQMVLMEIAGDSLEPRLSDGDTVLINQGKKDVLAGKLFAIGIGDLVLIKKVDTIPGKLILRSINPAYQPIEIDLQGDLGDQVRIIGRVIWQCREW